MTKFRKEFAPKSIERVGAEGSYFAYRDKRAKEAGRKLSKQVAETHDSIPEAYPFHHLPPHTPLEVQKYRRSSKIAWPLSGGAGQKEGTKIDRKSLEQSAKSRNRCAFAFLNSEMDFETMTLLSYPGEMQSTVDYEKLKSDRKRFLDRVRRKFPDIGYGWFLEFGEVNMNPHFHVFFTHIPLEFETVTRKGEPVEIATRQTGDWIRTAWMESAGIDCEKARAFNHGYFDKKAGEHVGGMIEKLRCPEGAAAYAAKEGSKRVQKSAPYPVAQWWQLSRNCKPKERELTHISVAEYCRIFADNPRMMSRLWEQVDENQFYSEKRSQTR